MTLHGDERDFKSPAKPREFEIDDFIFEYEPLTGWEKLERSYIINGPNGKVNPGMYALVQATKFKEIPWAQEYLSKLTGINKDWSSMSFNERLNVMKELNEDVQVELIKAIWKTEGIILEEVEEIKKKS